MNDLVVVFTNIYCIVIAISLNFSRNKSITNYEVCIAMLVYFLLDLIFFVSHEVRVFPIKNVLVP